MIEVNYFAVLVAAVAAFMVGWLWYGPLFGKPWRKLMNVPEGGAGMGNAKMSFAQAMTGGFIATVILVFVLAEFLAITGTATVAGAVVIGLWLWLGVAAVMSNMVWYESRPFTLYLINASHYLAAILLASAVLSWWPW
jgi:hypothetical protein